MCTQGCDACRGVHFRKPTFEYLPLLSEPTMVYVWCTARTMCIYNALKHCGFVIYAPWHNVESVSC